MCTQVRVGYEATGQRKAVMKESELEQECCKLAWTFGWSNLKGFGRSGGADRIFFKKGRCFFVEFKVSHNKQSGRQVNEELLCQENGTSYTVVRSLMEMRNVLLQQEAREEIQ